ncbi:hypothetical protein KIW84_011739 [Lathyrus oleraceus]|uniref:Retrovirus-related Pol polyprotein from transposon TNT 1-94 n=1 Tax=Pisum sativum TaxID=3888 RepID=A0A9D5BFS2_PEA|nr:hypothetical protein KIW84_011739 [Pisum sativum]
MASDDDYANTAKNMERETPLVSQFNSKNIFKTFMQQVTLKIDENNFQSWRQQIEGIIRTHKLRRFLVNPEILLRYPSDEDHTNDSKKPNILESIDDPVSHRDQLEAILDGFPDEFNALVSIIPYRPTLCHIIEDESMLLNHEAKLDRSNKRTLTEPMFVNTT